MTAPGTPVEALAVALDKVLVWRPQTRDFIVPGTGRIAEDILAHLPSGWSLISAPTLAARLHEACRAEWASMSARDRAVITQHGPDAHLGEAARLLGVSAPARDGGGE